MLINVKLTAGVRGNIKNSVLKIIDEAEPHSIFFISDFASLGSPETIRKILYEATLKGTLVKVCHGIYVKPKLSRFGIVPVSLEKIAKEIANRDKSQILPTGNTAANLIGLSPQVPMNLSYITTGSSRTIKIGNRKILFRHASPKNFAAKGHLIPLLVQGMKEVGEDNFTEEEFEAIKRFIHKNSDPYFFEDSLLAPVWIQRILKKMLQQ